MPIRLTTYEALLERAAKLLAPSPVRAQWAILAEAAQPHRRCDEDGRAFAGSQLQVQTYVNRRRQQLDATILALLPDSLREACINWRSPLEEEKFAEYMDGGFLDALGLSRLRSQLRTFWPRGGPHWDGLATLWRQESSTVVGYLLIESKSYPDEMLGSGCTAESDSGPYRLIKKSLNETAQWAQPSTDAAWLGPLYQYANRLAHVHFLQQETGLPVWLVNLCFTADPHRPTSQNEWRAGLKMLKRDLGFETTVVPQSLDVFLPAVPGRDELLKPVSVSP